MAMNPEQLARLMSGIKLADRAKVIGLPGPKTVEEKRTYAHIDSHNSNLADPRADEKAATASIGGLISLSGAPRSIEQSGLTADGFQFDESQLLALKMLCKGIHVCLIGAAGTGKTTMVKHALAQIIYGGELVDKPIGVRQLSGDQGPSIAICAFTGIATQVIKNTLPAWLHQACKTIHQLLEYKPVDKDDDVRGMFRPSRHGFNKLDHDVIVIDEASMLGLDLWHNLVDALRPHTRIILIGDLNQLKPVADATMFAYALSAGIDNKEGWSIAELTTIHRQKEAAANRIVDGAYEILNGRRPAFDKPTDPDWRIIGYELPAQAMRAHDQIVSAVKVLSGLPTPGSPERPIFDPYLDLLLTAGNGYDVNDSSSFVQQVPLNGTLSRMIEPPSEEHPLYIIDAGKGDPKRFAVHHRIMATKNESPAMKDRVTNGLTGRITHIEPNPNWSGNKSMFGTEAEVMAHRSNLAKQAMAGGGIDLSGFSLAAVDTSKFTASDKDDEKQSSHVIHVTFNNGAKRIYRSSNDVGSLQLAYAVTVHKAQGSQADTVIIVVHQAAKRMLSREWLYTAVTRARRRVVILYTQMGLSTACARQQIFGATLRDKVNRYRMVMDNGNVMVRLSARGGTVDYKPQNNDEYETESVETDEDDIAF